VESIKQNSTNTLNAAGFEVIGYEGYQMGDMFGSPGGKVWYIVRRPGETVRLHHCYISHWRGEYHIYDLKAIW
jgi:hypothetical protein